MPAIPERSTITMIKRKITRSDIFIIVANLVPVYGVWFLGWSAVEVFIVYALETIITGILTLLKLGVVTLYRKTDTWHNEGSSSRVSGLFFMFFFLLHFGFFIVVQTTLFSKSAGITPSVSGMFYFIFHLTEYINNNIAWMLGGFVISYLATSFIPFLLKEEYKTISMMRLMFQPYGRVFIQQFTVILGSMFLSFGLGNAFVLVFAIAKLFFEVFVDFEEMMNKKMAEVENPENKDTSQT